MKRHLFILLTLILGFVAPSQLMANSFSGRATVVDATVVGLPPVVIGDTGPLPSEGGSQDGSLLDTTVPGWLSVNVVHATTVAMGDASRSEASVANLNLTVAGNNIGASFLMSRAEAHCSPAVFGNSEIVELTINGKTIDVSGAPNQMVDLPAGGTLTLNEQSQNVQGNHADITVTALHVIVPGVADIAIARAHADITCTGKQCPADKDFVTGGGRISTASGKGTFGVAGGIKNGGYWGHLSFIDHGTGMKVKGTGVTGYLVLTETRRRIKGTCEIDGKSGYWYTIEVDDLGEPGRSDWFQIDLTNGYGAAGNLEGGNIQLHTCK